MAVNWCRRSGIKMYRVLLDTSFIIMAIDLSKDLFSQLRQLLGSVELVVTSKVVEELEKMSGKEGYKSRKANLALNIIRNFKIIPVEESVSTDQSILKLALKEKFIVATTDSDLIKKLKKLGIPVIYVKDGILKFEENYGFLGG